METKKELRKICRTKRRDIKDKEEKSRAIVARILQMPEVMAADKLFLFYPLANEINLLPLVDYANKTGKKIAFPLCEDKNGIMTFRIVNSLSELTEKSFGIKEPSPKAPETQPKNAVIFLPALAIDKKGFRLGYGKGYYDRYLAKYAEFKPFTVGVIYKELLFEELPHGEYDLPCDEVIWN